MTIILSRKGSYSVAGGAPSPVFPDGTLLSLPIPDPQSAVRYDDIRLGSRSLGAVVEATGGGGVRCKRHAAIGRATQAGDVLDGDAGTGACEWVRTLLDAGAKR